MHQSAPVPSATAPVSRTHAPLVAHADAFEAWTLGQILSANGPEEVGAYKSISALDGSCVLNNCANDEDTSGIRGFVSGY